MSHHVVFLDNEGIAPSVKIPELSFAHTWESYGYTANEDVVPRLQNATVALTCSVPLRAEHLRQLPKLKMISLALTGTDIVDMDYCQRHDITVTNVPGYASNTVAEHVVGAIYELFRRTSGYSQLMQRVRRGDVAAKNIYFDYRVRDVAGKTLGIIGTGPIAQRLDQLATQIGMHVLFDDRNGSLEGSRYIPRETLLRTCDVISVNVPLTRETHNMIDAAELHLMKTDAIIINTARGGIINEAALMDAMQRGTIGGAAIDVVVNEPITADEPLLALTEMPNFILTPHMAWSSEDAMQTLISASVNNINAYIHALLPAKTIEA
ncbi:NAD(P)-dependent oxidoreductase [Candidatus Pantoea multigeneris]|uniref:D-2-hydroxyacid dehydrogenase n=1 Tax=Candidatus Pantoea multigeneris TaxID=2608357 RepID=A0ABX0R5V7_9GAMM|nr:NAD(P)-dependent oxidoreductase [Pantoea multigeneris]NIF20149.1 D-2-hydroxyacid dehydrogenase [Pantoea multigeneris]